MARLSEQQKAEVISLLRQGYSTRQIGDHLHINHSTVSRLRAQHCPDVPISAGGRPPLLSPGDIRYATRLITTGQAMLLLSYIIQLPS